MHLHVTGHMSTLYACCKTISHLAIASFTWIFNRKGAVTVMELSKAYSYSAIYCTRKTIGTIHEEWLITWVTDRVTISYTSIVAYYMKGTPGVIASYHGYWFSNDSWHLCMYMIHICKLHECEFYFNILTRKHLLVCWTCSATPVTANTSHVNHKCMNSLCGYWSI